MPPKTTDDNTGADQAAADAGEANGEAAVAAVEQAEAEQEELAEKVANDEFGNPIPDEGGNDEQLAEDAEQVEEDLDQLDEDLEQLAEDAAPAPEHGSHNAATSGYQTDASGSYTPPGLVGNPQLAGSTFKQQ